MTLAKTRARAASLRRGGPKTGRRNVKYDRAGLQVHVRLDQDTVRWLESLSDLHGVSRNHVIRTVLHSVRADAREGGGVFERVNRELKRLHGE